MKKIPTLFRRDMAGDRSRVTRELAVDLPHEAIPTVKWDGTACLWRQGRLWARYDAKPGRIPPPTFAPAQPAADPETGHWPGWVPVDDDPQWKRHREALERAHEEGLDDEGTYELIGPKVNGNPHGVANHRLVRHGAERAGGEIAYDYDSLESYFKSHAIEGIVWWLNGEPVAKIKRRDFGLAWPVKGTASDGSTE